NRWQYLCQEGFRVERRLKERRDHWFGVGHYAAKELGYARLFSNEKIIGDRLNGVKIMLVDVAHGKTKQIKRAQTQDRYCSVDVCGGPSDHDSHEPTKGDEVMVPLDDQILPVYKITFDIFSEETIISPNK